MKHNGLFYDSVVCLKVVVFDLGIRKEQKTLENKSFQGFLWSQDDKSLTTLIRI